MSVPLHKIILNDYKISDQKAQNIIVSYELFGLPLHTAPIVLINHALTGNSHVAGENGWWIEVVGDGKVIDTQQYTVLCFNIPGNGFDGNILDNYRDFNIRIVAKIFLTALKKLNINKLHTIIGGSIGGAVSWEIASLHPTLASNIIPIASDWHSTDWVIANAHIQELILNNSKRPLEDARTHAMLTYRTPVSFTDRFQRTKNKVNQEHEVVNWLEHHGEKLKNRYLLQAYQLMNHLLKTIDVVDSPEKLVSIKGNVHLVSIDSDYLFTAEEIRKTYHALFQIKKNVFFYEIQSIHGHDAFLMEYTEIDKILQKIFHKNDEPQNIEVLKFGGKSLENDHGISQFLNIIQSKIEQKKNFCVVVSARGNATENLLELLELSKKRQDYKTKFEAFKKHQIGDLNTSLLIPLFENIENLLKSIYYLEEYTPKVKDAVLAQGELIAVTWISTFLKMHHIQSEILDARSFIKTDSNFGAANVILSDSERLFLRAYKNSKKIRIIPGFIGSNHRNETTTLGRNGSNYSASLIANFLDAVLLENYTHVDGIYSADPEIVENAFIIESMSYEEANEMVNFGTNVLHAKTIIPLLQKQIPIKILNTFKPNTQIGTLIHKSNHQSGARNLSVLKNKSLIHFIGRGLLGKIGVDSRVFSTLSKVGVNINLISQGSSERGIGIVIDTDHVEQALQALHHEFRTDIEVKDVEKIFAENYLTIVSIIGEDLHNFDKPFQALIRNQITPILFNNTITGKNISLLVHENVLSKALKILHGEIFNKHKTIHLSLFGNGQVGGALIHQILQNREKILQKRNIDLKIFSISNSKGIWMDGKGLPKNYQEKSTFISSKELQAEQIIAFAKKENLENLIVIDNTASHAVANKYELFVQNGFDIVSSNKIHNTLSLSKYKNLRSKLTEFHKTYLYETNVGAGLPLIDNIKLLHLSGDNILKITGVFSGSLSYIFNTFSEDNIPFSEVIIKAMALGYTEPDPREDLTGNDVARKLLILARELDFEMELNEIQIENLIPESLREIEKSQFLNNIDDMNAPYLAIKNRQEENHVLRYVGNLEWNPVINKGQLEVKLLSVSKNSVLGRVSGSDSIFEIYTESYGDNPIIIQGAGAGAQVTARGVFGDILKISEIVK